MFVCEHMSYVQLHQKLHSIYVYTHKYHINGVIYANIYQIKKNEKQRLLNYSIGSQQSPFM